MGKTASAPAPRNKQGRLAAKGTAAAMAKKPLIGQGKSLSTQIYYHVEDATLFVGSPEVYAAMQQFAQAFRHAVTVRLGPSCRGQ